MIAWRVVTASCAFVCAACAFGSSSQLRGRASAEDLARCDRDLTRLATDSIPDSAIVGSYEVRLVGESRYERGRSVTGLLELHQTDPLYKAHMDSIRADPHSDRAEIFSSFYEPIIGTASIDLNAVGASTNSDMSSRDPAAPGVYLMRTLPALVLGRFPISFDGSSTSMTIVGGNTFGFWGRWSSSLAISSTVTKGRFCARRTAD